MTSRLNPDFLKRFAKLPKNVRTLARANYRLWRDNPNHLSLEFKRIHATLPIYSVRVGIAYRAAGLRRDDQSMVWFFIGSHAEYDKLTARL